MTMTDRERFEAFISAPPFERRTSRFPENPRVSGWPGQYRDPAVQLAWEAWQAAQRTGIEDIGKALKETGAGMEDDDD